MSHNFHSGKEFKAQKCSVVGKLILLITITTFSCDYQVKEEFIIKNDSCYDLILHASFVEKKYKKIYDSIPAGTQKVFFLHNSMSGQSGIITRQYTDLKIFNFIEIFVNDSLRLSKDINVFENWEFKVIKRNGMKYGAKECLIFTVENQDCVLLNLLFSLVL